MGQTSMNTSFGPGTCAQAQGVDGVRAVNDLHTAAVNESSRRQAVSVADDTVLLAIALHNNGASGVDWNRVRNIDVTQSRSISASQTANLDREDVFSALALGIHDHSGSLEGLACVADFTTAATETATDSQQVSLDQNTVLLAIALHNSVNSSLNFDDVANVDEIHRDELRHDQDVTVPRDDTFLALALGDGGSMGTGAAWR
jgi:hypothetical protein